MNKSFKYHLGQYGWKEMRHNFLSTNDPKMLRTIASQTSETQKNKIVEVRRTPIESYNQIDFVKQRVAIEA